MPRVRVFHWKAVEAEPLLEILRKAGHAIDYDESPASYRTARQDPPDVFVIDLTRLPATGREVAIALRASKATRRIPMVFVDGDPEKVEATRRVLPDANYTTRAKVRRALRAALAKTPDHPVVPVPMMQRYAGRSVAQKLGIAKNARVAVIDPPPDYRAALGALPEGVEFHEESSSESTMTLWFFRDPGEFQPALRRLKMTAARQRLWVLWRKGRRDGLNETIIRDAAIAVGLVDYKVCSFNETWSALALAVKRIVAPRRP